MQRTVVFLSWENRLASVGGLGTTTRLLPQFLSDAGERVLLITPFHRHHPAVRTAQRNGEFRCCFHGLRFECGGGYLEVTCYQEKNVSVATYHLDIRDRFRTGGNPYSYADPTELLYDSLFFCAAVPDVLARLGVRGSVVFHANDWETAPIAPASRRAARAGILRSPRSVMTLHNCFDFPVSSRLRKRFLEGCPARQTILQCCIPRIDGALTTVSKPFAVELRHDPLLKAVFAGHLQECFAEKAPVGIESGAFVRPDELAGEPAAAKQKARYRYLLERKRACEAQLREVMDEMDGPGSIGTLEYRKGRRRGCPLLFMAGRMDLSQKGFDVVFHAVKRIGKGKIKLLFCPSDLAAGTGQERNLEFFASIAHEMKGDIAIRPVRMPSTMFRTVMRGASYLLMPSLYEPFGAASEGLLHGTPVVGRATGGLLSQVHPVDGKSLKLPSYYRGLVNSFRHAGPSGILFRENVSGRPARDEWRDLLKAPLHERPRYGVYRAMVDAATRALEKSIEIYRSPERYAELMHNGASLLSGLGWGTTVRMYRRVYDDVCSRDGSAGRR